MGVALRDAFCESAAVFERAGKVLGASFLDVLFRGETEVLQETRMAQPAVFVVSIAAAEALSSCGIRPCAVAGHSLGEYSALVAAGAVSFEDALTLVRERARLMSECAARSEGAMVAVIGLTRAEVEKLIEERAQDCPVQVANVNCPGQIVVSGRKRYVHEFSEVAMANGARRTVPLRVSGAFHSDLMAPAAEALKDTVEQYRFSAPRVPFVSTVTADYVTDPEQIRRLLVAQVCRPVLWEESVRRLIASGHSVFVETGPARVLQGLVKRISPEATVLGTEHPEVVRETALKVKQQPCRNGGSSAG